MTCLQAVIRVGMLDKPKIEMASKTYGRHRNQASSNAEGFVQEQHFQNVRKCLPGDTKVSQYTSYGSEVNSSEVRHLVTGWRVYKYKQIHINYGPAVLPAVQMCPASVGTAPQDAGRPLRPGCQRSRGKRKDNILVAITLVCSCDMSWNAGQAKDRNGF